MQPVPELVFAQRGNQPCPEFPQVPRTFRGTEGPRHHVWDQLGEVRIPKGPEPQSHCVCDRGAPPRESGDGRAEDGLSRFIPLPRQSCRPKRCQSRSPRHCIWSARLKLERSCQQAWNRVSQKWARMAEFSICDISCLISPTAPFSPSLNSQFFTFHCRHATLISG